MYLFSPKYELNLRCLMKIVFASSFLLSLVQSKKKHLLTEPRNRFHGMNSASLCNLAGWYDNPILTRFLAPIDCLKFQLWLAGPSLPFLPLEFALLKVIIFALKNKDMHSTT